MSKPMSFDEFYEGWSDDNSDLCNCGTTSTPPCAFCEGSTEQAKEAYEEYLEDFEEETNND